MLKVCRICDTIVGELEKDEARHHGFDLSTEVVGNVAFTLCPQCLKELDLQGSIYLH